MTSRDEGREAGLLEPMTGSEPIGVARNLRRSLIIAGTVAATALVYDRVRRRKSLRKEGGTRDATNPRPTTHRRHASPRWALRRRGSGGGYALELARTKRFCVQA